MIPLPKFTYKLRRGLRYPISNNSRCQESITGREPESIESVLQVSYPVSRSYSQSVHPKPQDPQGQRQVDLFQPVLSVDTVDAVFRRDIARTGVVARDAHPVPI
jgi:hypothetical protein